MSIFNEKYGKFLKMQKMNLPEGAIKHKMGLEGLTLDEQNFFFLETALNGGTPSSETSRTSSTLNFAPPMQQPNLSITMPSTSRPFLDELKKSKTLKCVDKCLSDKSAALSMKKLPNKPVSLLDEMKNNMKFRREVISPTTAESVNSNSCKSTFPRTLQAPQQNPRPSQSLSSRTTVQFADDLKAKQSFQGQSTITSSKSHMQSSAQHMTFADELKERQAANRQTNAAPIKLTTNPPMKPPNPPKSFACELKEKQAEKARRQATTPFALPAKAPSNFLNKPKSLADELKLKQAEKAKQAQTTSPIFTAATIAAAQPSHAVAQAHLTLPLAVEPSFAGSTSAPSTNLLGDELKLARLRRQGLGAHRTEKLKSETMSFTTICTPTVDSIDIATSVNAKQGPSVVVGSPQSSVNSATTNPNIQSSATACVNIRNCTSVTTPTLDSTTHKPVPSVPTRSQEVVIQKQVPNVITTLKEISSQKRASTVIYPECKISKYISVEANTQAPTQTSLPPSSPQAQVELRKSSLPTVAETLQPKGIKLIISGAPASGKGTYSEQIKKEYGVVHLSTGDMLREAIRTQSALGLKAKEYVEGGKLVPDEIIIDIVLARVQETECVQKGWLLDGFPRTAAQAEALFIAGVVCDAFIQIDAPDSLLLERVLGRRLDPVTGKVYHVKFSPPESEEISSRLNHRADDTEEKFKERLKSYYGNLNSVTEFYTDKILMVRVESSKQTSEIIFKQIQAGLTSLLDSGASAAIVGLPATEPGLGRSVPNVLPTNQISSLVGIPAKSEASIITPVRNEGITRDGTVATFVTAFKGKPLTTSLAIDSSKPTTVVDTDSNTNIHRLVTLSVKPPTSLSSANRVSSASTDSFASAPHPSNVILSTSISPPPTVNEQRPSQRKSQQLPRNLSIRPSQRQSQQQSQTSVHLLHTIEISSQADSLSQSDSRSRVDSAPNVREVNSQLLEVPAVNSTSFTISPMAPTMTFTEPSTISTVKTISLTSTVLAMPSPSFESNCSTAPTQIDKPAHSMSLPDRASLSIVDVATSLYKVTRDSMNTVKSIVNPSVPPLCIIEPIVTILRSSQSFSKVKSTSFKATRSDGQSIPTPRAAAHNEVSVTNSNEPVPLLQKFKKSRKHNTLGAIDTPNSPRQVYPQSCEQQRLSNTPHSGLPPSPRSPQSPREIYHVEKAPSKGPKGSTRYFFAPPAKQNSFHGHSQISQLSQRYTGVIHSISDAKTPWIDITNLFFGSFKSSASENHVGLKNGSSVPTIDYNAIYIDTSKIEGELTAENSPASPVSSYKGQRPFSPGSASPAGSSKSLNSPVKRPTQVSPHQNNQSDVQVQVAKANTKSSFFSSLRLF